MLKKLVQSLYSGFDKDPHGVVALRIGHGSGAAWSVQGRTLTLSVDGVPENVDIALSGISILDLAGLVEDLGFDVVYLNADVQALSASTLLDGEGGQSSGASALSAYTSTLWGFLDAIAAQLELAGGQIEEALEQVGVVTASAEYLDDWGLNLGVARLPGMSDSDYRGWIIEEVSRLRLSPGGIAQAVEGATGYSITIREPWMEIFKLDGSELSGGDAFYDGALIDYHTIQPEAFGHVDWDLVLPIIHRNRAAGIGVLTPRNHYAFSVDASDSSSVFAGHRLFGQAYPYPDVPLLSYMEIGDAPILNNSVFHIRDYLYAFLSEAPTPTVEFFPFREYRLYFYFSEATRNTWLSSGKTWANHSAPWLGPDDALPAVHTRS